MSNNLDLHYSEMITHGSLGVNTVKTKRKQKSSQNGYPPDSNYTQFSLPDSLLPHSPGEVLYRCPEDHEGETYASHIVEITCGNR